MKKIWNWIISIPKDKLLHSYLDETITGIAILCFLIVGFEVLESCAYGWGVGVVFGIAKEIYDEKKKHSSEASDWAADLIGATKMALYSYLILLLG